MINETGVRFRITDPQAAPLAPHCIMWQRRYAPLYRSSLPRGCGVGHQGQQGFIQITLGGCGIVTTAGGVERVPRGRCLVTTMQDELTYECAAEGWEFVYMTVLGRAGRSMLEDLVAAHGHVQHCDPDHRVVRGLRERCADEVVAKDLDPATGMRVVSEVFAALLQWNAPHVSADRQLAARAADLLSSDLQDPPGIGAVAAACGVSREHLTRLFTREFSQAPGQWLRSERLEHAAVLLRSSTRPIADIANSVGFRTPSAFVAAFRRRFAVTPGVYRSQ